MFKTAIIILGLTCNSPDAEKMQEVNVQKDLIHNVSTNTVTFDIDINFTDKK